MDTRLVQVGTVQIDSKSYQLVRTDQARSWNKDFINEPPWDQSDPTLVSERMESWHMGGLKSREGIPGSSEYGQNTDTRYPFRLLPSPKINYVTLTGSVDDVTSIFEVSGKVFVCAGRYVFKVDPGTDTVSVSKDFGAVVKAVMGLRWESDIGLVTTDAATNSIWSVTPGTPDVWTQQSTGTYYPYRISAGINRLFAVNKSGLLKNCSTGLDPLGGGNYADSVQCGATDSLPTGIQAYERTVLVGKPEGLFGVDVGGLGVPLIRRMGRDANNCAGMSLVEPHVYVPNSRSLDRYLPGTIEAIGLEREILNDSGINIDNFVWKGFAVDGRTVFGILYNDSSKEVYIMNGRDRQGNETALGPVIWDTFLYSVSGNPCNVVWISHLSATPRLYFGYADDLCYVKLDNSERDDSYGYRYTYKMRFGDWGDKDFPKFSVAGHNLTANKYWQFAYSIDGGSWQTNDIDGNDMKLSADGLTTFYLPTTAKGQEIQYRFKYTSNSTTNAPELNYFEAFAMPIPRQTPVVQASLLLAHGLRHTDEIDPRTAEDQFNDLQTLKDAATAITTTGPWGDAIKAHVSKLKLIEAFQSDSGLPELLVQVKLTVRETS